MKTIYRIVMAVFCIGLLASCSKDDDSAFQGQDNYISSFKLTLGESSFIASISGTDLVINTVEGRVLDGATATVQISENAEIYPDPTSISDWDNAHTFVVTAFNGDQQIYHYTVNREKAEEIKKGSFTLTTQTEVEDFGSLGVKVLDGNLTLGYEPDQEDPIVSLGALKSLEEVKGAVTIAAAKLTDLAGLDNVRAVGSLSFLAPSVNDKLSLTTLILPQLETVYGSITQNSLYGASSVTTVYLPKLTTIEGDFIMTYLGSIVSFVVPELRTIEGKIEMAPNSQTLKFTTMSFPKLERVGGEVALTGFNGLKKIEFPELTYCGGITWGNTMDVLEEFSCPKMTEIVGTTSLFLNKLESISFPELVYAETLTLTGPDKWTGSVSPLKKVDLSKLKEVENIKIASFPELTDLEFLGALETVTGTLTLEDMSGLSGVTLPASLTSVNELAVSGIDALTELDMRGMGVKGVNIKSTSATPFKLTADDVMEGSLTLDGIFELVGMKEVRGDVSINMATAVNDAIDLIPNTEKVGGGL